MGFPARMPPEPHSLFPDRPIRPLPKRRLRERLTPDVADAIPFPPAPGSGVPLFAYPWNTKDEPPVPGSEPPSFIGRETTPEATHEPFVPTAVSEPKSQDETPLMRSRRAQGSRKFHDVPTPLPLRGTPRPGQLRQPSAPQPSSLPPSTDGYDSFENTNNKKKRKIPTAGEVILNGTHPLNDQATLGILSAAASVEEDGPESVAVASAPYYQTAGPAISNQGISGSSRGRYARVRNGRSPLRTLSDPNSLWPGRSPKLRDYSGIISDAVSSGEKLPSSQGQENIGLLQQQVDPSSSGPSSSSQFTFVEKKVPWPGSRTPPSKMTGGRLHPPSVPAGASHHNDSTGSGSRGPSAPAAQPKQPRRRGNSLAKAAKQRRKQTQENNYHHPPAPEDLWVCEYCEYERIFGRPPEALIRQYEIKDRKRRREDAERRRLLEKAKMKSRKGRKGKLPAKNSNVPGQTAVPDADEIPGSVNEHWDEHEAQSVSFEEEYYEDNLPPAKMPDLRPLTDDERREAEELMRQDAASARRQQDGRLPELDGKIAADNAGDPQPA